MPAPDMTGTTVHGADIAMIFTPLADPRPLTAPQQQLARQMRAYWAAFAATGEPAVDGAPVLARYSDGTAQLNLQAPELVVERGTTAADRHHCTVW